MTADDTVVAPPGRIDPAYNFPMINPADAIEYACTPRDRNALSAFDFVKTKLGVTDPDACEAGSLNR